MIAPRPSPDDHVPKPGFPMRPFFGVEPVLMDEKVLYTRCFDSYPNPLKAGWSAQEDCVTCWLSEP